MPAATYHEAMRRWFVILMIVLLPLRAWAGSAMLMSSGDTGTPAERAHPLAHAPGAPPCHLAAAPDPDGASAADHDAGLHASHLLCDICNGPALTAAPATLILPLPLRAPAPAPLVRFASAWPSRDHRPPIA